MATTAELARYYTTLDNRSVDHLQRLVASWGLLADLSFSDLLLHTRLDHARARPGVAEESQGAGPQLVVLGQVRPLTSQTLYREDLVGEVLPASDRPLVFRCLRSGQLMEGEVFHDQLRMNVREECIPVRHDGEVIAVLTRETPPAVGRHPGELERAYVEVFNRLLRMVAAGQYPFAETTPDDEETPRVGDGAMVLDQHGRVAYVSPNGVSALHRIAVHANVEGMRLGELGLDESAVRTVFSSARPATVELEKGTEVTVLLRVLPLLEHDEVVGALALLRDVSELRRRDRLLVSKDATIREIHHRVKNNLQTISSLLRLQARRLATPEAKGALEESVRRIRSIALVHETLSHEAGDDVPFMEIVKPLVRMVEEGLVSPEHPVRFSVDGDPGILTSAVATPLSVVLTELLQNVVDHAFVHEGEAAIDGEGHVALTFDNDGTHLRVTVTDDGVGVPPGFDMGATTGLGLTIVRTLVHSELGGTITMTAGSAAGSLPGTVVSLTVPIEARVPEEPRGPTDAN
jgi:two-component sensor histidine kinase